MKNPDPKLIPNIAWDLLYFIDQNEVESFGGLCESIINNSNEWT